MFKLVYYIRCKSGDDQFRRGWLEEHGPLVVQFARVLGIYRYVQNYRLVEADKSDIEETTEYKNLRSFDISRDSHDVVDEYLFNGSPDDLVARMETAAVINAWGALIESEARYVDFARSTIRFVIEVPQINPPDDSLVALPRNRIIKLIAAGTFKPEEDEWLSRYLLVNHGPLVRKWAPLLGCQRYFQHHPLRHPLVERFCDMRGLSGEGYDSVTFLWVDSADAKAWGTDRRMVAAWKEIVADENNIVGHRSTVLSFAKEYVFFDWGISTSHTPT